MIYADLADDDEVGFQITSGEFIASWPHVPVGERKRSSFKTDHDATDVERIGSHRRDWCRELQWG